MYLCVRACVRCHVPGVSDGVDIYVDVVFVVSARCPLLYSSPLLH